MNTVRRIALVLFAAACSPALAQLQYVPLQTPCRALDTRVTGGAIAGGTVQTFDPGRACGIPSQVNSPIVFAMNVTVVPHEGLGTLTVWPAGAEQPIASTLNSYDGRVKANYTLVAGGVGTGDVSVFASNTTDVILDVSGYFLEATATGPSMLYTPVSPCRLIDTRNATGALGGPSLAAAQLRTFSVAGQCGLPDLSGGGSLSVNVTAVPKTGALNYLSVWGTSGTGNEPPAASTLNSYTGTVVANAAFLTINPSTNTSISAYASQDVDLVVDVNGYFSEEATGLAYYPTAVPERILDTRTSIDPDIGGPPFTGEQTYPYTTGQAVYVLNATVVPTAPLWVLSLWPDGIAEPVVSTLNSYDATVTSNMAIVSTGADGAFDAFAQGGPTQLILDLSGSFMPRPTAGPLVAFVGDEMSAGLVAAAAQPNWQCVNCLSTTTSAFALANLPAVIAMKPSLIHILVGGHELSGPVPVNDPPAPTGQIPLQNIIKMVNEVQSAKIPVVVGTMPLCDDTDNDQYNLNLYYTFTPAGESVGVQYVPGVTLAGYSIGGPPVYTPNPPPNPQCNGIDPSALGYQDMVPDAKAAIMQAMAAVQHGSGK